jgi:hypothetical protein
VSEANLWEWLRDVALPLAHYSRIESPTSPGFPDVHCQIAPGCSPTLELKFSENPNSQYPFKDKKGMRRSQIKWIRENIRSGGTVWIIAEVTPHIYIIPGKFAGDINGATHKQLMEMAYDVVIKNEPEMAAEILARILRRRKPLD